MKSLNAKRIAAIVTGAALLGAGLAFAGPLTFQNVPIISNSGQPVVQVVIGSSAKPSDGVAAGNIAAAIGNLAYTSTPVTALVNANSISALKVSVSSAHYSLTNQQVWLNESGVTSATGSSYLFSALIGSVLNQALASGSIANTKTLSSSTTYAYNRTTSTTASPIASPYTSSAVPYVGFSGAQGGGVTFNGFIAAGNDNLLQVSHTQLSSLQLNSGSTSETEYLWLTGFPVYDAQSNVNNFALLSAGGAYQVVFGKPINNRTSSNAVNINTGITMLGQNYTIINATPQVSGASNGNYKHGGVIYLGSSVAPLQTVYVGHNISSGPWTVQLQDLAQTTNGVTAPAAVAVYYNGVETNETIVNTSSSVKVNVTGHQLFINVQQTFAGLYAYQKWAKMQLYAGVFKVSDAAVYNQSTNPGWYANLLWTNTSTGTKDNALYSIILRNTTTTTLLPGQSFSFIQKPSVFKLTFVGDTLGNNYDPLQITSETVNTGQYQNTGKGGSTVIANITEPEQILQVTSSINNAFSYSGQTGSTVSFLMNPYALTAASAPATANGPTYAILTYTNPAGQTVTGGNSKFINATQQLNLQITGYNAVQGQGTIDTAIFSNAIINGANAISNVIALSTNLFNVTSIAIQSNKVLPTGTGGSLTVNVVTNYNGVAGSGNSIGLLTSQSPEILYTATNQNLYQYAIAQTSNVIYNQQNGQTTTNLLLSQVAAGTSSGGAQEYAKLVVNEYPVPSSTSYTDSLGIGLFNSTTTPVALASPMFILNYSTTGSRNNVTYTPTTGAGNALQVQSGFRTEKGSKAATISPTVDTLDMATQVDQLQYALTNAGSNAVVSKAVHTYGPYTVGQATNLPNVSIAAVNATPVLSGSSTYTIIGEGNLTATPSVTSAVTPVWLTNLSSTAPLVVLDSQANSGSNLILVGSGYVNSLSSQLQSAYNVQVAASSAPIVQAYGGNRILVAGYSANQTLSAANSFISQLYAAAASS